MIVTWNVPSFTPYGRVTTEHVRKGLASLQTVSPWQGEWLPTETELVLDVYVHPRHLVAVEVLGYAFTESARYCIGLSLGFLLVLCRRRTKQPQRPPTLRTRLPYERPSSTCRTGASRRRKTNFLR